ncbi:MAG: T9SS type A sorting domain-containing protein, partial [Bacteroidales bacterium]|nr:T9SS type A sorting domain-containing protein [Bacteroidales bacterium]
VAPRFCIFLAATYDPLYWHADFRSIVYPNRSFVPIIVTPTDTTTDRAYRIMEWDTARYNYKVAEGPNGRYRNYDSPFLFPILTPPPAPDTTTVNDSTQTPDSTGTGVDTNAAVLPVDLMQSFVTISPNPAADRVQVLSSFGLVAIEVYDADGRQVHAEKVSGLARTIDTGHWPRGIYMLHITTPYGPAVRKLVLR